MLFPVYFGHALVDAPTLWIQIGRPRRPAAAHRARRRCSTPPRSRPGAGGAAGPRASACAAWAGRRRSSLASRRRLRRRRIAAARARWRRGAGAAASASSRRNLGVLEKGRDPAATTARISSRRARCSPQGDRRSRRLAGDRLHARALRGPLPIAGELDPRGALRAAALRRRVRCATTSGAAPVSTTRRCWSAPTASSASGYEKNLLIPFTEYVPFAAPGARWRRSAAALALRRRGRTRRRSTLGPWRIATPICYEAVPPGVRAPHGRARRGRTSSSASPTTPGSATRRSPRSTWRWRGCAPSSTAATWCAPPTAASARSSTRSAASSRAAGCSRRRTCVATVRMLDGAPTLYGRVGDWPGVLAAGLVGSDARAPPAAQSTFRRRIPATVK